MPTKTRMKSTIDIVWESRHIPIEELRPLENNPRTITPKEFEKLERDHAHGVFKPIVLNADYTILAGNQRYQYYKKKGAKEAWCSVPETQLTEKQAKEIIMLDNTHRGVFDMDILASEFEDTIKDLGLDFQLPSIEPEVAEDDFEEPQEKNIHNVVRGDIWQLGEHRLMCGDSTSVEDVERLMDGGFADQLVTDPPYNVNYEGGTKEKLTIKNDKMEDTVFRAFLRDSFLTADAYMRPGATFYIWHADLEGYNFRGACKDVNWKVRQCLIWNKSSMVLSRQDYHWKHKPCLYGWKEGPHLWASDRKQTTVIDFDKPNKSLEHPTMKPVELVAYCVRNNTNKGDAVLDLFGGSGSTLIACEQLDRRCYMMELDEHYCSVIIERWQKLTGKQALRS